MKIKPFNNLFLKISGFMLAFFLWVHVATNKSYEYVFELPLQLTDTAADLILVTDPPESIFLRVKATGKQLISILINQPQISISTAGYDAGSYELEISGNKVVSALTRSYENLEILSPKKLPLKFETKMERKIPIRAGFSVSPALGFALMGEPVVAPETVIVVGPSSVMRRLRYLQTEATEFANLNASIEITLDLVIADSLKLSLSDSTVQVAIAVEMKKQKTFSHVAIASPLNFNTSQFRIIPATLSLTLEIPESQIDSFSNTDFSVSFRRPTVITDSVKAAIRYNLPENIEIIGPAIDSLLIVRKS